MRQCGSASNARLLVEPEEFSIFTLSDMEEGRSSSSTVQQIAVVTGGNKGIGLEICRLLASAGVKVILTARDEMRGTEAVQKLKGSGVSDIIFHQLDVTDASSIESLAGFLKVQFGKIDILVNNAGIGGVDEDFDENSQSSEETPNWLKQRIKQSYQGAEACLKTNYHGLKGVTKALIPLLNSSHSGRIVNVASTLGKLEFIPGEKLRNELADIDNLTEERLDEISDLFLKDFKNGKLKEHGWPTYLSAYIISKVLVIAHTRILARNCTTVLVNSVCPGFVKTDINFNNGILTVEEGAKAPVMLALGHHGSSTGLFYSRTEVSTF